MYGTHRGLGVHIITLVPENSFQDLKIIFKILLSEEVVYNASLLFIKLSILALYWRLFHPARYMRITLRIAGPVVVAWSFALVGPSSFDQESEPWKDVINRFIACCDTNAMRTSQRLLGCTRKCALWCQPIWLISCRRHHPHSRRRCLSCGTNSGHLESPAANDSKNSSHWHVSVRRLRLRRVDLPPEEAS